jgi:hypothetical protein
MLNCSAQEPWKMETSGASRESQFPCQSLGGQGDTLLGRAGRKDLHMLSSVGNANGNETIRSIRDMMVAGDTISRL